MKLSQRQMEYVSKWIKERAGGFACPECNFQKPVCWDHFHAIYQAPNPKTSAAAGARFAVVIECTNCGYIRMFSARTLGFALKAEKPTTKLKANKNTRFH
jgi:DNA-directed RNA polymerase subunit RPC12/RpoP